MTPLVWWLFVWMSVQATPSVNGPMASKQDCQYVEKQMRELKPQKMACIEVPLVGEK